jgi:steroid 5-alpha reductase family enzyme
MRANRFFTLFRRAIVRGYVPSFVFHVFNWTFISFMQSILLFLLAAPVYPILLSTQFDPEVQTSDIAFAALNIGLVIWEIFADQQQWGKPAT